MVRRPRDLHISGRSRRAHSPKFNLVRLGIVGNKRASRTGNKKPKGKVRETARSKLGAEGKKRTKDNLQCMMSS